jgi:ribonuclease Z
MVEHHILIDCGEGTQMQLERYKIKKSRLDLIFISHVHADHILGLPGLIFSMNLMQRDKPLHIFGPPQLFEILQLFIRHSNSEIRFPIIEHVTQANKRELLYEDSMIRIFSFPLYHRVPTTGFVFEEQPRLRKLNAEACEKAHIPFTFYNDLKKGKDYISHDGKTIIKNKDLTIANGVPVKYAYASDTIFDERIAHEVYESDVLYHESTFLHNKLDRAIETMHTTALQAGQLAGLAKVKKLLIGHFSSRYDDLSVLLNETKTVFANTEVAEEGKVFPII